MGATILDIKHFELKTETLRSVVTHVAVWFIHFMAILKKIWGFGVPTDGDSSYLTLLCSNSDRTRCSHGDRTRCSPGARCSHGKNKPP